MRTPTQAMIWEMWRHTRWGMLGNTGILLGFIVLLVVLTSFANINEKSAEEQLFFNTMLRMTLLGVASMASCCIIYSSKANQSQISQSFCRPISTRLLVMVPMAYMAVAALVLYCLYTSVCRITLGVSLPLLPVLFLLPAGMSLMSMAALPTRSEAMRALCITLAGAVISTLALNWFLWTLPGLFGEKIAMARWLFSHLHLIADDGEQLRLLPVHYAALAGVILLAFWVAPLGVARQRCGETLCFKELRVLLEGLEARLPRRTRSFGGAWAAQFWYEMRRGGAPLLQICIGALGAVFLISFAASFFVAIPPILTFGWGYLGFVFFGGATCYGAHYMAGLKRDGGTIWLGVFDATRPAGSGKLIAVKMTALLGTAVVGVLMISLAGLIWTWLWGDFRLWVQPESWGDMGEAATLVQAALAEAPRHALVKACLFVSFVAIILLWTAMSWFLIASLWFEQLNRVFSAVASILIFFHILAMAGDAKHGWRFAFVWQTEAWLMAAILVTGTIWLLAKAIKKGLVTRPSLILALGLWLAFVGGTMVFWSKAMRGYDLAGLPLWAVALSLGVLFVPLAPFGAAPLALDSLRHR